MLEFWFFEVYVKDPQIKMSSLNLICKKRALVAYFAIIQGTLENPIHYKTIGKLIREEETKEVGWAKHARRLPPPNLSLVRTKYNIRKVKKAVLKKNRTLSARKLRCSLDTVSKIIHQDLGLDVRKKKKVHHLNEAQKKQRYERGEIFIEYIRRNKVKKISTMDETWITLDDSKSEGEYYYTDEFLEVPDDWRKKPMKHWPKKIMLAIVISWNGMSKPYVVDGDAKVTTQYSIDNVLSPMVENDVPRLHPKNRQ
ncbi:hypothetical protein RvY_13392 [Ramazzottius varieornatus]|uniref:Transposase Tc1-like domain-containing protein n=1 Tax=Ramazzottius varieornatus TaxID=947166 RepID=A0A1D1VMR3_RAMVA|nr:hypothetical protein RvY_13392 [Ramazzottius varieornatus]